MIDPIRLNSYLDDELTPAEKAQLEAELKQCSQSQAECESIRTVRALVMSKVDVVNCPNTWRTCVERLDQIDSTRKTEKFVNKYAWALCAGVFGIIVVGGAANRTRTLNGAELPNMMSNFAPSGRTDQALAQRTAMYDQVLGRANQELNGMRLLGVTTGDMDGHHIEKFTLRDAEGVLVVFAVEGQVSTEGFVPLPQAGYESAQLGQSNCITWQSRGKTLMMMGERPFENLVRVAQVYAAKPGE